MNKLGQFFYSYLKNRYESFQVNKEQKFRYQIELDSGEPTNIKGFKSPAEISNKVSSQYIDSKTKFMHIFFKQFERTGIVIYYLIMILHFTMMPTILGDILIYAIPLSMHYVLQVTKALYFDYCKQKSDKSINNRLVTRFKRLRKEFQQQKPAANTSIPSERMIRLSDDKSKSDNLVAKSDNLVAKKQHQTIQSSKRKDKILLYETVQWHQIEVGDMIYLKRNETAPADLLLLDVSDDIIQLNVQQTRGQTQDTQRFPTALTRLKNSKHKPCGFDYKKVLTGSIKYDIVQGDIKGYIRLKKDPKGESFDKINVIYREEQLKTCQYAIGVVLFAGKNTNSYRFTDRTEKKSFFVQKSRMFFFLTFIIGIVLTIISSLENSFSLCSSGNLPQYFAQQTIIFYLTQYLRTLPVYFYLCIDLIEMANAHVKYILHNKSEESNSQNRINYQQINSGSIGDIVMTEYVCFDKTGTLTTGDFRIRSILIEDMIFKFSQTQLQKQTWNLFKENFQLQLKENPNMRIAEVDELSDDQQPQQPEERKAVSRTTGVFRMNISVPTFKQHTLIRNTKQHSSFYDDHNHKKSLQSEVNSQKNSHNYDENIIENLKPEDLDDTHCRITSDLKTNKPKPFFNKSPNVTQIVSQSQSMAHSPHSVGGVEELQLVSHSRMVDDNKSLQSDKNPKKGRSDSDGTRRAFEDAQKLRRQISAKKHTSSVWVDGVQREDEIELDFQKDQDFYQRLYAGTQKHLYQEAILSILLCQEIITRFSPQDDQFMHDSSQITLDIELQKFAAYFDIRFICANETGGKINYVIDINGEINEFQVLAINPERAGHPRLGVIIQFPDRLAEEFGYLNEDSPEDQQQSQFLLIVREETNFLPGMIEIDKFSREYWDKVFTKLHQTGMRTVVYSKLYLKDTQKNDFLEKYQMMQYSNQEDLVQLFNDIEKDMQIIQVIGVKEKIRPQTKMMIQSLKQADLSLNILSGDELSRVLPIAYKTGLLSSADQIINFELDLSHNVKLLIKNQLSAMAQQIKSTQVKSTTQRMNTSEKQQHYKSAGSVADVAEHSEKDTLRRSRRSSKQNIIFGEVRAFSILLSGDAFRIIQQDGNLYTHFAFILYFCNSLIGYKLDSTQKAAIVRIIQTEFQGNKRVMTVGDAYNDSFMFRQANIGIQFQHYLQIYNPKRNRRLTTRISNLQNNRLLDNPLKRNHYVKDIQHLPTADLLLNGFDKLCGLMFFESRVFAEVYDDLLVFCFYRSLLINYISFFMYSTRCITQSSLLESYWLVTYQSIILFIQQIASLVSKLQRSYSGDKMLHREQFKHNVKNFKKKKVLSFIFKINGNAMLDALLLYLTLNIVELSEYSIGVIQQELLLLLFASDLVKLCVSASFQSITWVALLFAYLCAWLLLSLLSVIHSYELTMETFVMMFNQVNQLFGLFFYMMSTFCLSYCIEAVQPLFCQTLIANDQEFVEIQTICNQLNVSKQSSYKRYHNLIKRIAVIVGKIFKNNKDDIDISISDMVQGSNLKVNQDKVNPFSLRFQNKDTEMKFKRLAKIQWLPVERYKLILSLLFVEGFALLLYILYNLTDLTFDNFMVIYSTSIALQLFMQFVIYSSIYSKHFFFINSLIVYIRFATKVSMDFTTSTNNGQFDILLTQIYIVIIMISRIHIPALNFILASLSIVGFFKKYSSVQLTQDYTIFLVLNADIIIVITCTLLMSVWYQLIKLEREDFMLAVTLNQETASMNNVLSILLPKFIRDRINAQGVYEIQENQGEVSILFCDMCGFDNIVAVEKENIVTLLDQLFRAFDALCAQNGMQKIETVGKTYMAAGGLKAVDQGSKYSNQNPVKRAVNLANEMQEHTKKFKFGQVGNLVIKIGIHYGRVIAGVIGHHKPQFSLIGDTVNTTSRVCSTGIDGMTTLSNEAYQQIQMPELVFIQRVVNAKGKGDLITWQVSTAHRSGNKKVKKRGGLILAGQEPKQALKSHMPALGHSHSIQVTEKIVENKQENDQSSKSIDIPDKPEQKQRRRPGKGPTLVLRHQPVMQSPSNQNIFRMPSNQNIIEERREEGSQGVIAIKDEQSFTDRQNLLQELCQKLRKDIYVELIDDQPEFEVEYEKVKIQLDEDNIEQTEGLALDRTKFYLGFEDRQHDLAEQFINQNSQGKNIVDRLVFLHSIQFVIKSLAILVIIQDRYVVASTFVFCIRIIGSLAILILSLLQTKKFRQKFYKESYFITVYILLLLAIMIEFACLEQSVNAELQAAEGMSLIFFFSSLPIVQIKNKVYFILVFMIAQIIIALVKFNGWAIAYFTIFQAGLMFYVQFSYLIQDLNTFNNRRSLEQKKTQSGNLVKYLLPSHILKQFLSNTSRMVLTDQFEDCTLLFADIAGFTEYSSRVEPEQVVNMLRNLFTEFDKSCLLRNAYKLYTIGDCYVAFGVIDAAQRNPALEAKNVVDLGFLMIEIIRSVRQIIGFDGLDMRIGIHTGKVIGGILGTEIVRYDIYGADVMISNKMESNGEKGRIQVSEQTKQLIESQYPCDYQFIFHKSLEFNSINRSTNGYFIEQIHNDSNEQFGDLEFGTPINRSQQQSI